MHGCQKTWKAGYHNCIVIVTVNVTVIVSVTLPVSVTGPQSLQADWPVMHEFLLGDQLPAAGVHAVLLCSVVASLYLSVIQLCLHVMEPKATCCAAAAPRCVPLCIVATVKTMCYTVQPWGVYIQGGRVQRSWTGLRRDWTWSTTTWSRPRLPWRRWENVAAFAPCPGKGKTTVSHTLSHHVFTVLHISYLIWINPFAFLYYIQKQHILLLKSSLGGGAHTLAIKDYVIGKGLAVFCKGI